jgi:hypothetical protein
MSDKEWVIVRVESHETEAQIVVGFLRSQGIEALISEDDAGDQLPSLEPVRGVNIFVPLEDAELARRLLDERETSSDSSE